MAMLMTGCGTTGAAQGEDGYCALYKPVLLTEAEIRALTATTKRSILRNNELHKQLRC